MPLHEWEYDLDLRPELISDKDGILTYKTPEPTEDITTWIFEEDSFVPVAKLQNGERFSIFADHLGTPVMAVDGEGKKVWEAEFDIYGKMRTFAGKDKAFIPFRYQGQYEDEETGLYYNRFRYYSPDSGTYISQDPIGLAGGMPNMYSYVHDVNSWVDLLGLNVFWSGGEAAQKAAEEFAKSEGGIRTILENTDLGKVATELADEASAKGIPWPKGGRIAFDMASEEFALNAVNDYKAGKLDSVDIFIDVDNYGKYGIPTWERIEKPILEKNNVPIKEHKFSSGTH